MVKIIEGIKQHKFVVTVKITRKEVRRDG